MQRSRFQLPLTLTQPGALSMLRNSVLLSVIPGLQVFPRFYDATEPRAGSRQKNQSQESQHRLLFQFKHMGTCPAPHHTHIPLSGRIMTLGSEKLQSFDSFKSKYPEGFAKPAHVELEQPHPAEVNVTIPAEPCLACLTT